MKPQPAQRLRDILLLLGTLVMFSSYLFGDMLLWVGMVIAFSSLIPHFLFNKCPHCGHQLRPWTQPVPSCARTRCHCQSLYVWFGLKPLPATVSSVRKLDSRIRSSCWCSCQ